MNSFFSNVKRRVRVEIDISALERNYNRILKRVAPAQVMCVLKANAYGLGVADYAKALLSAGCTHFGAAEPLEALELKRILPPSRARVQILSSVLPDEIPTMVKAGVILPINGIEEARAISKAAKKLKLTATVHFKIDTGMGRLGILAADAVETIKEIFKMPNLDCEGIFSHFAMAYAPEDAFTTEQIKKFKSIYEALVKDGYSFRKVHIAASDAINNFPETAKPPFNLVRTGINLHGSFDPNGRRALKLEPVLTLKTRVAQVRILPAGTTLGYGRTWKLSRKTKVAVICAGYADGLPFALANKAFVFIGGKKCRIIGRISMDYATVDVTKVPGVSAGDEVICLGASGSDSITPDDWAAVKGTHAYDIICSLGGRVQRNAVKK
jgi:alanine racemase